MKTHHPIITRFKKNPILTKKDVPYPVATVHNAGIVKYNDRYIMLFRSHLLNGRSIIGRGRQRGWLFIYGSSRALSYALNGKCFFRI